MDNDGIQGMRMGTTACRRSIIPVCYIKSYKANHNFKTKFLKFLQAAVKSWAEGELS